MHEIFIALAFVGMVAAPAIVNALPVKESDFETKAESNGFRSLSKALTNAKQVIPAAPVSVPNQ